MIEYGIKFSIKYVFQDCDETEISLLCLEGIRCAIRNSGHLEKKNISNLYGLHEICDDVVHLQHDQSYMGCRQLPVSYWMNL